MTDLLDTDPETAVRSYLVALDDPAKLIDAARVAELEAAVKSASDPIDKLKALSMLERARDVNIASYQLGFIQYAKQWATENSIPPSTFSTFGVDESTLKAAGLLSKSHRTNGGSRGVSEMRAPRSKSVSASRIKDHVATRTGTFTLGDIEAAVGGSPMTLRKAIGELVDDGAVKKLGTDPGHSGRGRAPILYERA